MKACTPRYNKYRLLVKQGEEMLAFFNEERKDVGEDIYLVGWQDPATRHNIIYAL